MFVSIFVVASREHQLMINKSLRSVSSRKNAAMSLTGEVAIAKSVKWHYYGSVDSSGSGIIWTLTYP